MKSGKLCCALAVVVGLAVTGCSGGGHPPGPVGSASGAAVTSASGASSSSGIAASMGSTGAAGSSTAPSTGTAAGDGRSLAAAMATVPASTGFEFVDAAAMKARWGMADLTSSVDIDGPRWKAYVEHARNAPAGPIAAYTVTMVEDWGWSWLDVDWSISPTLDGPPKTVYSLRDGLDMQTVIRSLTDHGYTRSGPDDRPSFRVDLSKAGVAPPFFAATVLPKQHLLVTGESPDAVLAAIDDPSSSPPGSDITARLLAGPAPEYAFVTVGAGACTALMPDLGSGASPSEVAASMQATLDKLKDLHPIDGWAVMSTDDTRAVITTDFLSAEHAQADADARTTMMKDGTSATTHGPLSGIFTVTGTQVSGRVLSYRLTVPAGVGRLTSMVMSRDTPWAICP